ncbi:MAG: GatB/YqeY domain-containing protein, partial [Deltaproteobacteria bacterium]|nr:GatB/YqeY domain-containing protein [Deltaproteobacteria bacterium]
MELKVGLQEAAKSALKSGDSVKLSTLRLVLAAVHNEEIKARKELAPEEIQRVISTLCKQRMEAIELYRKGCREELARKEEAELKILQEYLPQPLTDEEVQRL